MDIVQVVLAVAAIAAILLLGALVAYSAVFVMLKEGEPEVHNRFALGRLLSHLFPLPPPLSIGLLILMVSGILLGFHYESALAVRPFTNNMLTSLIGFSSLTLVGSAVVRYVEDRSFRIRNRPILTGVAEQIRSELGALLNLVSLMVDRTNTLESTAGAQEVIDRAESLDA